MVFKIDFACALAAVAHKIGFSPTATVGYKLYFAAK